MASLACASVAGCGFQRSHLWGTNLSGLRAHGSFWREADLSSSTPREADRSFAQFQGTNLGQSTLRGAALYGANCQQADPRDGQLREAHLQGALLDGAHLAEKMPAQG